MIQDIKPYTLNNHFDTEARLEPASRIIIIRDNNYLLNEKSLEAGIVEFPHTSDFDTELPDSNFAYIFTIGEDNFFLYISDKHKEFKIPGYAYTQLNVIRGKELSPKHMVYAAFTAYHLNTWYSTSIYCGRCGTKNEVDKKERAMRCPHCGNVIYPRINPAVIIGITDKATNKMVLTKYNRGYANFALVAGFTEIGETMEGTVEREVMEEVGLKVGNIRYYKSQPWGIASDILMGYFCDVDGDTTIHMDNEELKLAKWFSPEEIELQPTPYSLTNEMMGLFKDKGYEGTV
ncbi:MAG: NAD(+) diphosphatase [Butyrivibrio sp.]|nr:NAD(+) diphosphatase [Butyrivibrio sp.]MBR1642245.1 NAD(+) diphosphatase [Butyrivibrio sp.]